MLGSFWALGVLLGRSGGARKVPRASKSVKKSILKLFDEFKEVIKSSWSDLRASKIGPGGAGNGPGATKEVKMVDLGVILGSFGGSFWGHFGSRKVSSKKEGRKSENRVLVQAPRRFSRFQGSEKL